MKRIQMPSSYAVVTEEEKELLGGGGAFRDAWDSFTDHLRLNDFFFRGGLLSLSISFIPMLLFKNRNFVVCTITGMFIMLATMRLVEVSNFESMLVSMPKCL